MFYCAVLKDDPAMGKRNFKINPKALSAALGLTPKLIGGLARGTQIPERIKAAVASDNAQLAQSSREGQT